MRRESQVPEEGVIEYIQCDNGGFRPDPARACDIRRLIVWGGCVANIGEDNLSRFVDAGAEVLEHMTYIPDRTKGGVLIRPKYYRGDRGGQQVFPRLTELTIRLSPVLLPLESGWLMPGLQRLRLLVDVKGETLKGGVPCALQSDLRTWLGLQRRRRCLPNVMMTACPELDSISIALGSTQDETQEQTDWFVMKPPRLVPWEVHRLLLLPILHREQGGDRPEDDIEQRPEASSLASLTLPLLDVVLSFLGRRRWEYDVRSISVEVAERLQLSPDFCTFGLDDLCKPVASACAPDG